MTKEDVERIAFAIALVQSNPEAQAWAQRVADAWEAGFNPAAPNLPEE